MSDSEFLYNASVQPYKDKIERLTDELDQAYGDIASIRDDKNAEIERLTIEMLKLSNANIECDLRIAKLEAEVAQYKERLPDDYLTQLEFAQQENKRLNAALEVETDE